MFSLLSAWTVVSGPSLSGGYGLCFNWRKAEPMPNRRGLDVLKFLKPDGHPVGKSCLVHLGSLLDNAGDIGSRAQSPTGFGRS